MVQSCDSLFSQTPLNNSCSVLYVACGMTCDVWHVWTTTMCDHILQQLFSNWVGRWPLCVGRGRRDSKLCDSQIENVFIDDFSPLENPANYCIRVEGIFLNLLVWIFWIFCIFFNRFWSVVRTRHTLYFFSVDYFFSTIILVI